MNSPSSSKEQSKKRKKPYNKYCIVPMCKNTLRSTPDKLFFLVPRGAAIRQAWCNVMKREMVSPSTCLYCCEDHFDVEEDTFNYMQSKISNLPLNIKKNTLRLNKSILPHKFKCQESECTIDLELQPWKRNGKSTKFLQSGRSCLSEPPAKLPNHLNASISETNSESDTTLEPSRLNNEDTKNLSSDSKTSLDSLFNGNKIKVNNYIEVSNENALCTKSSISIVSSFPIPKTTSISPVKVPRAPDKKIQDKPDLALRSSLQCSLVSSKSFEPDLSLPGSRWIIEDDTLVSWSAYFQEHHLWETEI
ncbi:uncharacterized protein LOC123695790 [Colias croceus]|uniref:uncharacterized protein LOC123695790 n=1 Tax=Colias crocea TaxID=72248 RepID=UPI001E27AEC7|nr:uncharacterized protein LOC123695790 [Colias croceus]